MGRLVLSRPDTLFRPSLGIAPIDAVRTTFALVVLATASGTLLFWSIYKIAQQRIAFFLCRFRKIHNDCLHVGCGRPLTAIMKLNTQRPTWA
jgi:hypothetical protein